MIWIQFFSCRIRVWVFLEGRFRILAILTRIWNPELYTKDWLMRVIVPQSPCTEGYRHESPRLNLTDMNRTFSSRWEEIESSKRREHFSRFVYTLMTSEFLNFYIIVTILGGIKIYCIQER